MTSTPNEQIEIMTVIEAARVTHLDRGKIAKAMDDWQASRGRIGLAYCRPYGKRRMVRRSALRDWFDRLERRALYAY